MRWLREGNGKRRPRAECERYLPLMGLQVWNLYPELWRLLSQSSGNEVRVRTVATASRAGVVLVLFDEEEPEVRAFSGFERVVDDEDRDEC